MSLRIALDGMGGDHAPESVISGAAIAKVRLPEISYIVYGDRRILDDLISRHDELRDCCEVVHTLDKVDASDKPSQILRQRKDSSMSLAIKAVAEKRASAVVSGGNTGGLMALSIFGLKRLPGVSRPAIASFFPTETGESCLLDLGGNVEADAHNLLEFAIMGEAFAATALGISKPRVALLNIGIEELKGRDEIKQAASMIKNSTLDMDFIGFIEADALPRGVADVIVTDGFTGNIVIKTAAGVSRLIKHYLQQSIVSSLWAKLSYPFYSGALRNLSHHIDPRRYNGAVFLGLDGIAVKSHGSADDVGFASAIELAYDLIRHDIMQRTQANFDILQATEDLAKNQEHSQ